MNRAVVASQLISAESEPVRRPYYSLCPARFDRWLEEELLCAAGQRMVRSGRYYFARILDGADFEEALSQFRREVAAHRKIGFLALLVHDEAQCHCVEDELWLLGDLLREAGLAESAAAVVDGGTVAIPIGITCPVSGIHATYEFFSVAFTRHANDPRDRLYDPSLSAPFTAINTTSDAFGFAMFVRDQSERTWGCPPYAIEDRKQVERLFRRCITAWQNMSITTIQRYSQISVDPDRSVRLTEDRKRWIAPHNDPVFAELKKCPFHHEMPIAYTSRLCEKWLAAIFEDADFAARRDGQSGGTALIALATPELSLDRS